MHRYEAAGPGPRAGQYLSIAEADYGSEAEAWASVVDSDELPNAVQAAVISGFAQPEQAVVHEDARQLFAHRPMHGLDQQSGHPFDKSAYFNEALKEAVVNGHVPQARLDDIKLQDLIGVP